MSKGLSEETKYEFNVFSRQLNKDLSNLMEYLRKQDEDNKAILYVGRYIKKKVILPYEEYQKMCQRLEAIDNANPSEALEKLEGIEYVADVLKVNHKIGSRDIANQEIKEMVDRLNYRIPTIKQALLKAQEQEKVLEIIKNKEVDVKLFFIALFREQQYKINPLEFYNGTVGYKRLWLTQEEFDLLKRYFNEQDN